jgi:16S rRNA (guanine(966)-N(2))-methyltransferase RsmD
MRVVSGFLKGRRFELPSSKWKTRPTTDNAKESLFNILSNWIPLDGIQVLDLFAGTGNMSYEFASRGASYVCCVDKFAACARYIEGNAKLFKIEDVLEVRKQDVFQFLKNHRKKYDIVFADPPYDSPKFPLLANTILEQELLNENGLLIIEHDSRQNFANHPKFVELRKYGQSYFSFLSNERG